MNESKATIRPANRPRHVCSTHRLALVTGLLLVLAFNRAQGQAIPQPITTVNAVRSLTAEQAGESRPVSVKGQVTAISGWKNSFFFLDQSGGISIDRADGSLVLHPKDKVEVEGITGPGLFAPVIVAQNVKVLGSGRLAAAPAVNLDKLADGKLDSQRVAIKGVVRTAAVKSSWGHRVLFLDIDVGGGTLISGRVREFPESGWEKLPSSIVLLSGVCATNFNDKRQFIGLRLFVSSLKDLKVVRAGPADPFDRPLRPLGALMRFDPGHDQTSLVRVRGIVTSLEQGQGLYIEDGMVGVFIRTGQPTPVPVGSEIEAVGYPGGGGYSPSLENALIRVDAGRPHPVTPVSVAASAMIVDHEGFSTSPYDSRLVRLKGRLEQTTDRNGEEVLFVHDGAVMFTARLQNPSGGGMVAPSGSVIEVSGVCVTRIDSSHEARSFHLLLRSASDIVVLQRAPWWNASHAKGVVVALLLAVLLLCLWVAMVRRDKP